MLYILFSSIEDKTLTSALIPSSSNKKQPSLEVKHLEQSFFLWSDYKHLKHKFFPLIFFQEIFSLSYSHFHFHSKILIKVAISFYNTNFPNGQFSYKMHKLPFSLAPLHPLSIKQISLYLQPQRHSLLKLSNEPFDHT